MSDRYFKPCYNANNAKTKKENIMEEVCCKKQKYFNHAFT